MKKIIICLFILTLSKFLQSQNFQWAKGEGLWSYDYGYGITNDDSGNVYVAGKFELNSIFSSSTVICAGNHDGYLVKYGAGGELKWIRTNGGKNGDYAEAIHCDKKRFVYISGEIEGYGSTISFPPSSVTLSCAGDNDAYFAKYDLEGNLIFAKNEGGVKSEKALGITGDMNGNIYICGYFTDFTTFNGQYYNGYGGRDIYLAKYDSTGAFMWFRKAGSAGRDEAKFVKCDAAGNVYICGLFSKNANFQGQILDTYHSTNYYDAFLAKYSTDGNLLWVKSGGGDVNDIAWSLTIDNQGNIYIGGELAAYAVFGNFNVSSAGNLDIFVASYSADGTINWLKRAGGNTIDRARAIGSDGDHIFITGQFGKNAVFGSQALSAADSSDVFISALDRSGNFLWTKTVDGPPDNFEALGYESGNAICAEPNGNVYVTGALLADTINPNRKNMFGNIVVPHYSRTDVFVSKIVWTPSTIGLREQNHTTEINIYPNPSNGQFILTMYNFIGQDCLIRISDFLGQTVYASYQSSLESNEINLPNLFEGIYFLEVQTKNRLVQTKKLLIKH